jgi:hypothetical protein
VKITLPPKDKNLIEFRKDTCQVVMVKKQDRLIISGPCEIIFTDMTVDASLDYETRIILSMPRSNKMIKIQPKGIGGQVEQPGIKEQNKGYDID